MVLDHGKIWNVLSNEMVETRLRLNLAVYVSTSHLSLMKDGNTISPRMALKLLGHWTRRKELGYPLMSDPPFGSSVSHTTTYSYLNYSGIRKVSE